MTNEWVRYSDTKAVALLGVQGVLLGFLIKTYDGTSFNPTCFQYIVSGVGLIFNIISMIFAFVCLNPKLKFDNDTLSPIYFGSIALHFEKAEQYQEYINKAFSTKDQIIHELCSQIFVNSAIAYRKFRQVTYSLRCFITSLLFWLILLISFT